MADDPYRLIDDYGLFLEAFTRVHRRMIQTVERAAGLDGPELEVLLRVSRSPDQHLTMSALADQILLSSGGVTRLIDRMVQAGLVVRANCPDDRRVQWVTLTGLGQERLSLAIEAHTADLEEHFAGPFSPDEYAAFLSALATLRRSTLETSSS